jgi:hypothetical protein
MKRILAISLAALILFMSVGLSVGNHYCDGVLASSSLTMIHDVEGCGMELEVQEACANTSRSVEKKNCCSEDYLQLKLDDNFNKTSTQNLSIDFEFVAAFVVTYLDLYSFKNANTPEYLDYSPPLLSSDVQVMNQTFLI